MRKQLTEAQIEHIVEKQIDMLDKQFTEGTISQDEYVSETIALDKWASEQYKQLS